MTTAGRVVVLAVEQGLHLELTDDVLELGELLAGLVGGVLVVHLVRQLDEHLEVVESATRCSSMRRELRLAVAQRARDLLRLLGVVPEVRRTGLLAQTGDLGLQALDVDHRADVGEGGAQRLDVGGQIEFEHDTPD